MFKIYIHGTAIGLIKLSIVSISLYSTIGGNLGGKHYNLRYHLIGNSTRTRDEKLYSKGLSKEDTTHK